MVLRLNNDHASAAKQQIIDRIKSMTFLCIHCTGPNPIALSVVDFEYHASGPYVTAFFICPDCKNKFTLKIEDLGKVRK